MPNFTRENLTEAVIGRLENCRDERLKFVLTKLIEHAHAFVKEVSLTEQEWFEGIRFLTQTGQKCDAKRQEFVLLSDVLGISMLVDAVNHDMQPGLTETTVLGPFYVENPPETPIGGDISRGAPGTPLYCSGTVRDSEGRPIQGAVVDVWQSDSEGFYDVQMPSLDEPRLRGRLRTDGQGRYAFWSILPTSYPIPSDGPVGRLLAAAGRHPYRPAHVHFMIEAPGFRKLVTHVFVDGDPYLASDAVFGVKDSLIGNYVRKPASAAPGGRDTKGDFFELAYDFGLKPV